MLGRGPLLELDDQLAQAGGGVGRPDVDGEAVQRRQRLPALAGRAGAGRRGLELPRQPAAQHVGDHVAEAGGGVVVGGPRGAAQQQHAPP